MADISTYIQQIQLAAKGEEVRSAICCALNGINNGIGELSTEITSESTDAEYPSAKAVWVLFQSFDGLPEVSATDNGKFLRVVEGAWAASALANAEETGF